MLMKTILGVRAAAILYDLLLSREARRPFLLPANVCPIVPLTFLKAGVPFEFVDTSSETFHMDLDQAAARVQDQKERYGGLLYVHTYGDPSTPNDFFEAIKSEQPDLLLIDDRCLCVPDLEPAPASPADVVLYSTGYAKIVDVGLGGFAFIREDMTYRHHASSYEPAQLETIEQDCKLTVAAGGAYIYRDSNWLQTDAPMPSWQNYRNTVREALQVTLEQRKCINAVYDALIPEELRLKPDYQSWRYNIIVDDNQKVLAAVFAGGFFASAHYASLAGTFGPGNGSRAAELSRHVVNLFNDRHFSLDMAEKTAHLVLGSL
jgi:hypothetical protein